MLYRGYPIEQLAEKCDYLDVSYLLMHGELPNPAKKTNYLKSISSHSLLHDQLNNIFGGFRRDAHPMAVMVGVVGSMSAFYFDNMDINDPNHRQISAQRLIAKIPTIAAWSYTYNLGYLLSTQKMNMILVQTFYTCYFQDLIKITKLIQ